MVDTRRMATMVELEWLAEWYEQLLAFCLAVLFYHLAVLFYQYVDNLMGNFLDDVKFIWGEFLEIVPFLALSRVFVPLVG